jgi:peptidoglycan/xylan/chitin deacetylase (PgdA/CDA1 family)
VKKLLGAVAALLVSVIIVGTGTYQIINARTFQFFGGITHRVETSEKVVALTFDDGPTEKTPEILATLDRLDIKATFYVTGRELEKGPQYGRQIVDAGHELGNHSYSHQRMVFKDHAFVADEVERTDAAIRAAGHRGEITFRPPHGKKLLVLPYYLDKHDRKTITCDVEPDSDPRVAADTAGIVRNVTENTRPGSIILLHPMYARPYSRDAVPGIVEALRRDGYRFATVSELLRAA